jgi:hypothetical protein
LCNQYIWPAIGSDSGSNKPGDQGGLYKGADRNFAAGSLLAIPPRGAEVRKTPFLRQLFFKKDDPFAKTGSGHR